VALARAGKKVLVLEQHYLPGGWTHSFTLGGHRFSPGVHYLGDLHPGGGLRNVYEGLGMGADLEFAELNPDGFDHFFIAGERFDQPRGLERWRQRLHARFPHERTGIDRYLDTLLHVSDDIKHVEELLRFPQVLAIPFRAPSLLRWGFRTQGALLDACVTDPTLKAVFSAQSGNHGLAPSRISLPIHAAMTAHYHNGAFYPRGGAKRIPQAYIKELRRHGGAIRTRCKVARILVERGRAAGVEIEGGEQIRAEHVISNADPAVTYGKLLGEEHCREQLRKVERMEYSVSLCSVFAATDLDLRAMGYDSGNYWFYRTTDVAGAYERMEQALPNPELDMLFLSIPTLKDPGHRRDGTHSLEMFTFMPHRPFARWSGGRAGEHGPAYEAFKRDLGERMLSAAEHLIPDLRRRLTFLELGTPVTNDFYCETHRGAAYGTAKTPFQLGPFSFDQQSPVEGLSLCGASTISHGVAGASMSGLVAAKNVLGLSSPNDCLSPPDGSLRTFLADRWEPSAEAAA
jgi:phytoene dehydrogenase-like protein